MAENTTVDHNPPPPAAVDSNSVTEPPPRNSNKEDSGTIRESKRRKSCPTALDKVENFTPPDRTFSFTFDTKFSCCAAEFTPKFGSFNSTVMAPEKDEYCQIPATIVESKEEIEDEIGALTELVKD